jgi:hypothetical protein
VGAISSAAHKRSKKRGIRWRCQFDGIHTWPLPGKRIQSHEN